jgi:hypothetical protein
VLGVKLRLCVLLQIMTVVGQWRLGSAQLIMEEIGYELCRVATLWWLSR